LFIYFQPRYLVLLKEDVARLLLLRGVENAVDVLRHGSRNFYHGAETWQALLTDLEAAQEVLLLACCGKGFGKRRVRFLCPLKVMNSLRTAASGRLQRSVSPFIRHFTGLSRGPLPAASV
jgi:hypothetical protein